MDFVIWIDHVVYYIIVRKGAGQVTEQLETNLAFKWLSHNPWKKEYYHKTYYVFMLNA